MLILFLIETLIKDLLKRIFRLFTIAVFLRNKERILGKIRDKS